MGIASEAEKARAFIIRTKAVVFHISAALAELDAVVGYGAALGAHGVPWDMGQIVGREALVIGNAMTDSLRTELDRAEHLQERAYDYLVALGS